MTTTPKPLVVLARLMQVSEELAASIPDQIAGACELPDPEALGSSDVETLLECYQLAVAFLEETIAALREMSRNLAHRAGGLMATPVEVKPWGIVRRESDSGWSEWDHDALKAAVVPKIASKIGIDLADARALVDALPARYEWRPGEIKSLWAENPEEFARHTTGRRTIRTQRTDKLAAVAAELTERTTSARHS